MEELDRKLNGIVATHMMRIYKNNIQDSKEYFRLICLYYKKKLWNANLKYFNAVRFSDNLSYLENNMALAIGYIDDWLFDASSEEYYRFMQLRNGTRCKRAIAKGKDFYKSKEWVDLRRRTLERDGYKCKECGSKDNLHVHHVKYVRGSNLRRDLITLCRYCHADKHPINRYKILASF